MLQISRAFLNCARFRYRRCQESWLVQVVISTDWLFALAEEPNLKPYFVNFIFYLRIFSLITSISNRTASTPETFCRTCAYPPIVRHQSICVPSTRFLFTLTGFQIKLKMVWIHEFYGCSRPVSLLACIEESRVNG